MVRKRILATSLHPGGANAIIPVIKRLRLENRVGIVSIGHEFSEKLFDAAGIEYRKIFDYGLADVSLESMGRLLDLEKPGLVLTGTSVQDESHRDVLEQTVTLAAKGRGISSLAVLDYWGNYWQRFSDINDGWGKFKFLPDRVAIMDKYAEREMLDEGFDPRVLVITGNPHFDSFGDKASQFTSEDRNRIRGEIGLNQGLLLFYAGGIFKEDVPKFGYWDLDEVALINGVIQRTPEGNVGLVIKLHPRAPSQDLDEISRYVAEEGRGRVRLVSDILSHQIVLASDVTLTACSTVGIESVLMGKPCISLQPGLKCQDYLAIITKNEVIPVGYTLETCEGLVDRVITDQEYRTHELPACLASFKTDGRATERVTKLIYDILDV